MFSYENFCKINDSRVIHIEKLDLSQNLVYVTMGGVPGKYNITMFIQKLMQGRDYYVSNPSLLKRFFEDATSSSINYASFNFPKFISCITAHLAKKDIQLTGCKLESDNNARLSIYHGGGSDESYSVLSTYIDISYCLVNNNIKLHLQGHYAYRSSDDDDFEKDLKEDFTLTPDTLPKVLNTICHFLDSYH